MNTQVRLAMMFGARCGRGRSLALALGCATVALIAATPAQAQVSAEPAPSVSPTQFRALRAISELNDVIGGDLNRSLRGQSVEHMLGPRTRWYCDQDRFRHWLAELEATGEEARQNARSARAARGTGLPMTMNADHAQRELDMIMRQISLWRAILIECERQSATIGPGPSARPPGGSPQTPEANADSSTSAAAPSAGAAGTPPPGTRSDPSTMIILEGNMTRAARACDREAFEAAKQRLVQYIDRLISEAPDADTRSRYENRRLQAASAFMIECDEPSQTSLADPANQGSGEGLAERPTFGYESMLGSATLFQGEHIIPPMDIGFQVAENPSDPEAPEIPAGSSADRVSLFGGSLGVGIPIGGFFRIGVGFSHSEGDALNPFTVAGGRPSGIVFRTLSPADSSGISVTGDGLTGAVETFFSADTYRFEGEWAPVRDIRFRGSYNRSVRAPNIQDLFAPSRVTLAVFVEDQSTEHRGTLEGSGTIGDFDYLFRHESTQSVEERFIGLEVGAGIGFRSGDAFAELFVAGGPYHRRAVGSFTDHYEVNFGPASDRDFTSQLTDRDDGIGFGGRAQLSLGLQLASNVAVSLDGSAQIRSEVARIVNPISGDDVFFDGETVRLGTDSVWGWRLGATLTVRLP